MPTDQYAMMILSLFFFRHLKRSKLAFGAGSWQCWHVCQFLLQQQLFRQQCLNKSTVPIPGSECSFLFQLHLNPVWANPIPILHPYSTLLHPPTPPLPPPPYSTLLHPTPPYSTLPHPTPTTLLHPTPPYSTPPYSTLLHPYSIPIPSLLHPYSTPLPNLCWQVFVFLFLFL